MWPRTHLRLHSKTNVTPCVPDHFWMCCVIGSQDIFGCVDTRNECGPLVMESLSTDVNTRSEQGLCQHWYAALWCHWTVVTVNLSMTWRPCTNTQPVCITTHLCRWMAVFVPCCCLLFTCPQWASGAGLGKTPLQASQTPYMCSLIDTKGNGLSCVIWYCQHALYQQVASEPPGTHTHSHTHTLTVLRAEEMVHRAHTGECDGSGM